MDLEILNLKFGPETKWYKTDKCGWCENPITRTQAEYLREGNICNNCITKINIKMHMIKTATEQREIQQKLNALRQEMEDYGKLLDKELTEEETKETVSKMENLWSQIRLIKSQLSVTSVEN